MLLKRKNYSLKGTRLVAGINQKVLRKSPMAAKRSAIKTQNKALMTVAKGMNKVESSKRAINMAALNPGQAVNKATEATLSHPITVASNVVGKAQMVTAPTTWGLVPTGTIGTAAEAGLRKWSPKYARITDKMAQKYRGSRVSEVVGNGTNAMVSYLKTLG